MGENFWSRVKKFDFHWVWQGPEFHDGYGMCRVKGSRKTLRAHRRAWELLKGSIPDKHELHHKSECLFRLCVNPDHLELVTPYSHPDTGAGINRAKTHCARGHEYNEKNTTKYRGRRYCKVCRRRKKLAK